jgi:hypothetical protein
MKNVSESFIEIAQEINGREPILSNIGITANVQENMILHYKTFYFGKTCALDSRCAQPRPGGRRKINKKGVKKNFFLNY